MLKSHLIPFALFSSLLAINCSHINAQLSNEHSKEQDSRIKNQNQIKEKESNLFKEYAVMLCNNHGILAAFRSNPPALLLGNGDEWTTNYYVQRYGLGDSKSIIYFLKRVPGNHPSTWDKNAKTEDVKFYPNGNVSWITSYTQKLGSRPIRIKQALEIDLKNQLLYSKYISFNPTLSQKEAQIKLQRGTYGLYEVAKSECSKLE